MWGGGWLGGGDCCAWNADGLPLPSPGEADTGPMGASEQHFGVLEEAAERPQNSSGFNEGTAALYQTPGGGSTGPPLSAH